MWTRISRPNWDSNMKVLHLMVSGQAGGIESLLRDYVEYSRHENLFVFAWDGGPAAERIEECGCRVILMDKQKQGARAVCSRILALCEEEQVDVVIAHHAAPMLRLVAMAAKLKNPGIKVIWYAHSNAFELCDGRRKKGLELRRWIYRTTFFRADAAVAISHSVKDSLVRYLGLPEERITVIHNGAILKRFDHPRTEGGKTLRLIYVGRLIEEKGVQTILEARARLKDVDCSLTIVGDGDYREPLQALARKLDVDGKVRFLGTRTDVPELLARADVFMHFPECEEGFGIAVVEAMASGLMCVCGDRGALPEIVEDGVDGCIVKNNDPERLAEILRAIARNPESAEYETLRANAMASSRKFSIEAFTEKLDDLIEEA